MDIDFVVEVWSRHRWILVPDVVHPDLLREAQRSANEIAPDPRNAHSTSEKSDLRGNAFDGMVQFPFDDVSLSLICVCDPLLDLIQAILGTSDVLLYQAQLWAKYSGVSTYEQSHHRDYAKNTMIAPSPQGRTEFVGVFVYLTHTGESTGATALVSEHFTSSLPLEPGRLTKAENSDLYDREVLAVGHPGSVLLYDGSVFHRGTELVKPSWSRVSLKLSYKCRDAYWITYHRGLGVGFEPNWTNFVERATRRQLEAVGFPPASDSRWSMPQFRHDLALRYGRDEWD